jgi:hypothetical protein
MPLEMSRDRQRGVARAMHPQEQRAHAPLEQPRLEWPGKTPRVATPGTDPLPERIDPRRHDRAGQDVAVAVQILRRGVDDEIRRQHPVPIVDHVEVTTDAEPTNGDDPELTAA